MFRRTRRSRSAAPGAPRWHRSAPLRRSAQPRAKPSPKDYEIFLLARIKEAWDTTGDSDLNVAIGLARSGRIVTAAAILITVTGATRPARSTTTSAPLRRAWLGLTLHECISTSTGT
jgi:hypothetical protein